MANAKIILSDKVLQDGINLISECERLLGIGEYFWTFARKSLISFVDRDEESCGYREKLLFSVMSKFKGTISDEIRSGLREDIMRSGKTLYAQKCSEFL